MLFLNNLLRTLFNASVQQPSCNLLPVSEIYAEVVLKGYPYLKKDREMNWEKKRYRNTLISHTDMHFHDDARYTANGIGCYGSEITDYKINSYDPGRHKL